MGCNNSKNVDVKDQPADRNQPSAQSGGKFDEIEKGLKKVSNDPKELDKLWLEIDVNKDNKVNLTEVFRFVEKKYPSLNDPQSINKAYVYTTKRDGNGDAFVDRNEFPFLLRNLVYFAKVNQVFQKLSGGDGLINRADFKSGVNQLNLKLTEAEEAEEFKKMDKNGGGTVNFDEFVGWLAKRKCPIDGTVIQEFEASDPRKASSTAAVAAGAAAAKPAAGGAAGTPAAGAPAAVGAKSTPAGPAVIPADKSAEFDKIEKDFKKTLADKAATDSTWKAIDFNGNGKVSLAEIDKFVVEKYPVLNNKPALMRAYKYTTLREGDKDAWVERDEFPALLRNLLYFNRAYTVFDEIDKSDDKRIDLAEFKKGSSKLGLKLSDKDAETEFKKIDKNGGGQVLFDEFCGYIASQQIPIAGVVKTGSTDTNSRPTDDKPKAASATPAAGSSSASASPSKAPSRKQSSDFDSVEAEFKKTLADKAATDKTWKGIDFNGNGKVSLAEIDKFVVEKYPVLNNKPALMRAYKYTTLREGDKDAWVERDEFPALLRNLLYFNKGYAVFDAIDTGDDKRIDLAEFKKGSGALGLKLSDKDAEAEFKKIDKNGGGQVLFDEFCSYLAEKQIPMGGAVKKGSTDTNSRPTDDKPKAASATPAAGSSSASASPSKAPSRKQSSDFDSVEAEFKKTLADKAATDKTWKGIDFNGNGKVSLAEIDKFVVEKYPVLNNKPALMRAYKYTTLREGDKDAWVERDEFPALLRNLLYFNKGYAVFDAIDTGDDKRIDLAEFKKGSGALGLKLSDKDAETEFKKIDKNGGGQVLFDEFCSYLAEKQIPMGGAVKKGSTDTTSRPTDDKPSSKKASVAGAAISTEEFDQLEKDVLALTKDKAALDDIWKAMDEGSNNIVTFDEVSKYIAKKYPTLNEKPALQRAFKRATNKDADAKAIINRNELVPFLRNTFYFNKIKSCFDTLDTSGDGKLSPKEFKSGLSIMNISLSDTEADAEFQKIAKDGKSITFDDFCNYVAAKKIPVD